jgi:methylase of polypeptide subunit release factors
MYLKPQFWDDYFLLFICVLLVTFFDHLEFSIIFILMLLRFISPLTWIGLQMEFGNGNFVNQILDDTELSLFK